AGPRAPHRRSREGVSDRQRQLCAHEPRADDARQGPQGRGYRSRDPADRGVRAARRRTPAGRLGAHLRLDPAGRRAAAIGRPPRGARASPPPEPVPRRPRRHPRTLPPGPGPGDQPRPARPPPAHRVPGRRHRLQQGTGPALQGAGVARRRPKAAHRREVRSMTAPAATGLKTSRPDLSVWVVTGDGDALSIGGNHLIHILRRNLDVNILLFNNKIYGLTKGQYSPTSEVGKVTKSTPVGSIDHPFDPIALALGAEASFVARSVDVETRHLQEIVRRAHEHKGASFVELLQHCNVFNDGAFADVTEKATKADH